MAVWVVSADSARARIFATESAIGELSELQDLVHPLARAAGSSLASDSPGRQRNSQSGSHTMGHESDPKHDEADRFAREVADTLNEACSSGRCERLHLLAAPAFLGMLRKHLDRKTRERVSSEISANVVTHDLADIRDRLPQRL